MHRIFLEKSQQAELIKIFRETEDRRLRDRVQAVLMVSRGRARQQVAEDLAINESTLYRWLQAWIDGGVEGLRIQWASGRPPLIGDQYAEQVKEWVKGGPVSCGLDRANWTFAELATYFYQVHGVKVGETAMREFCHKHEIRPYRPTYRYLRGDPEKQAKAKEELSELKKKAKAGELVLLSQDEARFPMVPTLRTTLGVKGYRPVVGTWDCKDLVYMFGAINLVTGQLHTRLLKLPKGYKKRTGESKNKHMQRMFVRSLEELAKVYPAQQYPRVVLTIDRAPWHGGPPVREFLEKFPHIELYKLPSYSPQLNVIERLWKILRRRATHNRLFDTMKDLCSSLRSSICYYQTLRHRLLSLIEDPKKRAKSCAL